MKIFIFLIPFFLICQMSFSVGQERIPTNIGAEFDKLLHYKREYEKYREIGNKDKSFSTKRDSVYSLYIKKIESIKRSPDIYLTYINKALKDRRTDKLMTSYIPYDYYDTALPFNPDLHLIRRVELFEIIKKSLFERGDSKLPEKTDAFVKAGADTTSTYKIISR